MTVDIPQGGSGGGIEVTGASVGQIIVVKAVDDNGKPTEWKTADLPQGGEAEWKHYTTFTLEETATKVDLNFSEVGIVREVAIHVKTQQEKKDGTAYTAVQKARINVNGAPLIGWMNNFSGWKGFLPSFVHIEIVGAFIKCLAWSTTDAIYATAPAANGYRLQGEALTSVSISPWPDGVFSVGSTFELWYR